MSECDEGRVIVMAFLRPTQSNRSLFDMAENRRKQPAFGKTNLVMLSYVLVFVEPRSF